MASVSSTSTVVTSGSTTYVSSTASGLDTNALIDAAVEQKTARADTIDAKVTANKSKISSYTELQSLVQAVSDSLSTLAAPTYSATAEGNAFDDRQAYLTSSDGSTATNILAVSADSTATAASYEIEVQQLAKAMKVAGSAMASDEALGLEGVFSLGVEGGTSAEITITADMTLEDVAAAISDASETTGVSATMVKVSSGSYRLVISADDTAKTIQATTVSGDDVLAGLGVTDAGGFVEVLQQPQSAILTIDGIEITADSNELTDVIPGLSISLLTTTAENASVTLDVEADYDAVKTAITDFVEAYNALRDFVSSQQELGSDGAAAEDAVLFADSLLRSLTQAVSSLITQSRDGGDGDISHLTNLGLELDEENKLTLSDETVLDDALLTALDDIESFFESDLEVSDDRLKLLRNDSTRSLSFSLDLTIDADGALSSVTVGGQTGLFEVSGSRVVGVAGTAYEGLSFAFVSDEVSTTLSVQVDLTQGFANQLVSLADQYADTTSGLLQSRIDSLTSIDTDLEQEASDIRTDAEAYRDKLIDRYSAMETEVQAAQLLQEQIQAILNADSDDE